MKIRDLLKANPKLFVIHAKLWTDQRNTIESQGAHDPLIGLLITLLLCRREPDNDFERSLMQDLVDTLQRNPQRNPLGTPPRVKFSTLKVAGHSLPVETRADGSVKVVLTQRATKATGYLLPQPRGKLLVPGGVFRSKSNLKLIHEIETEARKLSDRVEIYAQHPGLASGGGNGRPPVLVATLT